MCFRASNIATCLQGRSASRATSTTTSGPTELDHEPVDWGGPWWLQPSVGWHASCSLDLTSAKLSYAHDARFMSACFPCDFEGPCVVFGLKNNEKLVSGKGTCGHKDDNVHGACTSVVPLGRFKRTSLECHIGQMLFGPWWCEDGDGTVERPCGQILSPDLQEHQWHGACPIRPSHTASFHFPPTVALWAGVAAGASAAAATAECCNRLSTRNDNHGWWVGRNHVCADGSSSPCHACFSAVLESADLAAAAVPAVTAVPAVPVVGAGTGPAWTGPAQPGAESGLVELRSVSERGRDFFQSAVRQQPL